MASTLIAVAVVSAVVFIALGALAADGFSRGDFSGEALARALQKDLEAGAAEHDHFPPRT
jgi:hypothetical protein